MGHDVTQQEVGLDSKTKIMSQQPETTQQGQRIGGESCDQPSPPTTIPQVGDAEMMRQQQEMVRLLESKRSSAKVSADTL